MRGGWWVRGRGGGTGGKEEEEGKEGRDEEKEDKTTVMGIKRSLGQSMKSNMESEIGGDSKILWTLPSPNSKVRNTIFQTHFEKEKFMAVLMWCSKS